jgi:MSHA biogenesis protein MshL
MQTTIAALIGCDSTAQSSSVDSPMVQVTADTGMIVVRAYPHNMDLVEQYLQKTENVLGREVIIEAEILDVTLTNQYAEGINWAVLGAGGITTATTPTPGLLSSAYQLSMTGDRNNFRYALKLISTQGKVSVLSRPRVSAINNQSAIIKVGSDNYYVTNVQSSITTNGTSTSSNTTTSTINLQAYFSGIALYVTPQITDDGAVNLHIHPSISQVSASTLNVTVDNQKSVLPVAESQIRETDTVVHAKDGQVIILGGLMQTSSTSISSGLPLDPKYEKTVGNLTTSKENSATKTELVILLRPLIVQNGVWESEVDKTSKTAYSKKSQKEFFDNARAN